MPGKKTAPSKSLDNKSITFLLEECARLRQDLVALTTNKRPPPLNLEENARIQGVVESRFQEFEGAAKEEVRRLSQRNLHVQILRDPPDTRSAPPREKKKGKHHPIKETVPQRNRRQPRLGTKLIKGVDIYPESSEHLRSLEMEQARPKPNVGYFHYVSKEDEVQRCNRGHLVVQSIAGVHIPPEKHFVPRYESEEDSSSSQKLEEGSLQSSNSSIQKSQDLLEEGSLKSSVSSSQKPRQRLKKERLQSSYSRSTKPVEGSLQSSVSRRPQEKHKDGSLRSSASRIQKPIELLEEGSQQSSDTRSRQPQELLEEGSASSYSKRPQERLKRGSLQSSVSRSRKPQNLLEEGSLQSSDTRSRQPQELIEEGSLQSSVSRNRKPQELIEEGSLRSSGSSAIDCSSLVEESAQQSRKEDSEDPKSDSSSSQRSLTEFLQKADKSLIERLPLDEKMKIIRRNLRSYEESLNVEEGSDHSEEEDVVSNEDDLSTESLCDFLRYALSGKEGKSSYLSTIEERTEMESSSVVVRRSLEEEMTQAEEEEEREPSRTKTSQEEDIPTEINEDDDASSTDTFTVSGGEWNSLIY